MGTDFRSVLSFFLSGIPPTVTSPGGTGGFQYNVLFRELFHAGFAGLNQKLSEIYRKSESVKFMLKAYSKLRMSDVFKPFPSFSLCMFTKKNDVNVSDQKAVLLFRFIVNEHNLKPPIVIFD